MLTDIVFWCLIVPFLTDERFALNLVGTFSFFFLIYDSVD